MAKQQIKCMVAKHMACPADDWAMLQFIYSFVDDYRKSTELYHSAAIIFEQPANINEDLFEDLFWRMFLPFKGRPQQMAGFFFQKHDN